MKNRQLQTLLATLAPAAPAASAEVENLDRQILAKLKGGMLEAAIEEVEYPPKPIMRDHGCSPQA